VHKIIKNVAVHIELLRQQSSSTFDIDLDHNKSQGQGYTSIFIYNLVFSNYQRIDNRACQTNGLC